MTTLFFLLILKSLFLSSPRILWFLLFRTCQTVLWLINVSFHQMLHRPGISPLRLRCDDICSEGPDLSVLSRYLDDNNFDHKHDFLTYKNKKINPNSAHFSSHLSMLFGCIRPIYASMSSESLISFNNSSPNVCMLFTRLLHLYCHKINIVDEPPVHNCLISKVLWSYVTTRKSYNVRPSHSPCGYSCILLHRLLEKGEAQFVAEYCGMQSPMGCVSCSCCLQWF